ncbi:GFA family protein [Reyranella massiliensis]|uniref:GFA family protein n=1 Tax=Reyranella massiliensis TaxID=445220 RepID=UPI0005C2849D
MLKGRCFCGAVRYESAASPSQETACHCSICRRTTGAPFVAWFTVPISSLTISGDTTTFQSSPTASRSFCPKCGTQITFQSSHHPDLIDLTTCSLESPEQVPPIDHTFGESRLGWVKLADELPVFPKARPS